MFDFFAGKLARALQWECSFSSEKSNEFTDQQDRFCFNHTSAFYTNNDIENNTDKSQMRDMNSNQKFTLPYFGVMCFNPSPPIVANIHRWTGSALVQIMVCSLFGTKPLSKSMLGYCQLRLLRTNFRELLIKIQNFSFTKMHQKISSAKWRSPCSGGDDLNMSYSFVQSACLIESRCVVVNNSMGYISFWFLVCRCFLWK